MLAALLSFAVLVPYSPVLLVHDPVLEVEVKNFEIEATFVKCARSSSAMCPAASVSLSIPTTDQSSIISKFVRRAGADMQFAVAHEKYGGAGSADA